MNQFTLEAYYKAINRIAIEDSVEVEVIKPSVKAGEYRLFLGIPVKKEKTDIYNIDDSYISGSYYTCKSIRNSYYMDYVTIVDYLREKYYVELDDENNVHIYRKAYVIVDDKIRYFREYKDALGFLSTIKGRCVECGNKVYKSL